MSDVSKTKSHTVLLTIRLNKVGKHLTKPFLIETRVFSVMALTFVTLKINGVSGMDACRASSCCHGARSALWTEVPAVPLAKAMRAVPVPVQGVAVVAGAAVPRPAGVRQRRWRSWISSPQRRLTRPSIRWTSERSPHSTTSHNIFSTDSLLTGKFRSLQDVPV